MIRTGLTIAVTLVTTVALADTNCPKYDRKSYTTGLTKTAIARTLVTKCWLRSLSLRWVQVFKRLQSGLRKLEWTEFWQNHYRCHQAWYWSHGASQRGPTSLVLPTGQKSAKEPMPMIWMIQKRWLLLILVLIVRREPRIQQSGYHPIQLIKPNMWTHGLQWRWNTAANHGRRMQRHHQPFQCQVTSRWSRLLSQTLLQGYEHLWWGKGLSCPMWNEESGQRWGWCAMRRCVISQEGSVGWCFSEIN